MVPFLDPDIESLDLSGGEKDGLQVFRNYQRAFDAERRKRFCETVSWAPSSIEALREVTRLIVGEEQRSLPVIACAYADEALSEMFSRELPENLPGGRAGLLSGFGPLANFSSRVKLAFAFGWGSQDILLELDTLRKVRNKISHQWNISTFDARFAELVTAKQSPIEALLTDDHHFSQGWDSQLSQEQRLRIRLVWILGRITYESQVWVPAVKAGLPPHVTLYSAAPPGLLKAMASLCIEATQQIRAKS